MTEHQGETRVERDQESELGSLLQPLGIVFDLTDDVVIGMHVLIKRRRWSWITHLGFLSTLSSEGRRPSFEKRRKKAFLQKKKEAVHLFYTLNGEDALNPF